MKKLKLKLPGLLIMLSFIMVTVSKANVTVTPATGGSCLAIAPGGYTPLGSITIAETINNDIPIQIGGTFILQAPAGFEFNPGVGSVSITTGADITSASINITSSLITVTLNVGNINALDLFRIRNIEVRATAANASGNILRTISGGTASINGNAPGAGISHGTLNATGASGTYTTAAAGNWSNAATWIGGVVPSCSDNVTINHQVNADFAVSLNNLTINNNGNLISDNSVAVTGTFMISGTGTYTHNNTSDPVTGIFGGIESISPTSTIVLNKWHDYNVPLPTGVNGKFGHLIFNAAGNWQQNGLFAPDRILGNLTVSAGILTLDNGTGMTTALTLNTVLINGTGRLIVNSGTPRDLTLTTGNFTDLSTNSSGSYIMFRSVGDLIWNLNGNLQLAHRFCIVEGQSVADIGSALINISGNFSVTGSIFEAYKSAVGPLTFNVTGTSTISGNPSIVTFKDRFDGDLTFNSGTFTVDNSRNVYLLGSYGAPGLAQVTINGDFIVTGSQSRCYIAYCDTNYNNTYLNVSNDLLLTDGQLYVGYTAGGVEVNVGRNFTQSGASSIYNGQKNTYAFGTIDLNINGSLAVNGGTFYQSRGFGAVSIDVTEVVSVTNATFGGMFNSVAGNNGEASLNCSDLSISGSKFYLHRGEITDSRAVNVTVVNDMVVNFTDPTQVVFFVNRAGNNNALLNFTVGGNVFVTGNSTGLFCTSMSSGLETISIGNDLNISGGRMRFNGYENVSTRGHETNGTINGSVIITGGSLSLSAQKGIANWTINGDYDQSAGFSVYKWNTGAAAISVLGNYNQLNSNAILYSKANTATSDPVTLSIFGDANFENATFYFDSCLTSSGTHELILKGSNVTYGDNTIFTHRSHLSTRTNFGLIRYDRAGTINLVRSTANFDMQQVKQLVTANTTVDFASSLFDFMIASHSSANSTFHTTLDIDGTLNLGTNMIAGREQALYYARVDVNNGGRLATGHPNGLYSFATGSSAIRPQLSGDYRMNYYLDANSTVEYNGFDNQVITPTGLGVATTADHEYGYLDINFQGTPDVEFVYPENDDVNIRTGLVVTDGELNLDNDHNTAGGGRILNLDNGATITRNDGYIRSETEDGSGVIRWNITTTGSFVIPFGYNDSEYIPFTYQPVAGSSGDVMVGTYHSAVDNSPFPPTVTHVKDFGGADNSANTVDRFWRIVVPGNVTSNLTFSMTNAERGGIVNPRAQLWEPVSLGWFPPAGVQSNPTINTTLAGTQTSLNNWWTLSSQSSPLPVELLSFDAKAQSGVVKLDWITASEINNDYFTVERSRNGYDFSDLLTVDGNGTTTSVSNYTAYDEQPYSGVNYYRLRQTDFDGRSSHSEIKVVSFIKAGVVSLFPNPFRGDIINLSTTDANDAVEKVAVYDATGKLVYSQKAGDGFDSNGITKISIGDGIAEGTYMMEISTLSGVYRERIVKL
ncbi:MAG: T9SS type A sorting domain-containing protein [Bacteroidia bacterium]|nr:T9SS type A sorting domain-containing protein [Bacteroidia bacterium]